MTRIQKKSNYLKMRVNSKDKKSLKKQHQKPKNLGVKEFVCQSVLVFVKRW